MEVTLKNIEVISAFNSVGELLNLELPIKTGWNITKNVKKLESLFNTYTECQRELIKKYAIKDEKGEVRIDENNKYKIVPKFISKFNEDQSELLNCDNTIDILKIKLSDLCKEDKDGNAKELATSVLLHLGFMIEDDVE